MLGDVRHRGTVNQISLGFVKVQALALRNAKKDKLIIVSLADILDDGDVFIIFIEAPVLLPSIQRDIQLLTGVSFTTVSCVDGVFNAFHHLGSIQVNRRTSGVAGGSSSNFWITGEIERSTVLKLDSIFGISADRAAGNMELAALHRNDRVGAIATCKRCIGHIDG